MDMGPVEVEQYRSEQWLLALYEEDANAIPGEGEPLSISLALGGKGEGHIQETVIETVRLGIVAVDVRTGVVVYDSFEETKGQRRELDTRLRHLRPLELVTAGPCLSKATESAVIHYCDTVLDLKGSHRPVRVERLPPEDFCIEAAQASLREYYSRIAARPRSERNLGGGEATITEPPCSPPALVRVLDLPRTCICALGPLMTHLKTFGLDRALAEPDLRSFSQSAYMTLDAVTLRDLEVLTNQTDGREVGSLFSILNRTQTAFGRRVLIGWLRQPLLSMEDIVARQDAVEELANNPPDLIEHLRPVLRDLKDLDPAIASLHHHRIQPSRLLSLLNTMRKVFGVFHPSGKGGSNGREAHGTAMAPRSSLVKEAVASVPADMAPVLAKFLGELNSEAAAKDDITQALVDGESLCSALTDAAEAESAAELGLEKELHSIRQVLRKPSLQFRTLRTGVTSTLEYLVELRKGEAKKLVPSSWMQVSQTKDMARFHTPGVLRLHQELLQARESKVIAAKQAWGMLVAQVDEACYEGFRRAVHALGHLDALLSLAAVAQLPGYVRPAYRTDSNQEEAGASGNGGKGAGAGRGSRDVIVLKGARHPTVEQVLEGGFVPNDIDLR
ncbi:unnamed protein product [Discosporangium mesarthrocarpum]